MLKKVTVLQTREIMSDGSVFNRKLKVTGKKKQLLNIGMIRQVHFVKLQKKDAWFLEMTDGTELHTEPFKV